MKLKLLDILEAKLTMWTQKKDSPSKSEGDIKETRQQIQKSPTNSIGIIHSVRVFASLNLATTEMLALLLTLRLQSVSDRVLRKRISFYYHGWYQNSVSAVH